LLAFRESKTGSEIAYLAAEILVQHKCNVPPADPLLPSGHLSLEPVGCSILLEGQGAISNWSLSTMRSNAGPIG
jgi:hypothetical protein